MKPEHLEISFLFRHGKLPVERLWWFTCRPAGLYTGCNSRDVNWFLRVVTHRLYSCCRSRNSPQSSWVFQSMVWKPWFHDPFMNNILEAWLGYEPSCLLPVGLGGICFHLRQKFDVLSWSWALQTCGQLKSFFPICFYSVVVLFRSSSVLIKPCFDGYSDGEYGGFGEYVGFQTWVTSQQSQRSHIFQTCSRLAEPRHAILTHRRLCFGMFE
jgi:hypothetical protein